METMNGTEALHDHRSSGRKPITLSTKPLSTFKPIEDEVDDEDFAEAATA